MAGIFKNTLTSAETTPSITCEKVNSANITLADGYCHISYQKCDSSGNIIKSNIPGSFKLSSADLTTIMTLIIAQGRADGVLQDGTTDEE